jgi:hypothetical protein
MAQTFQTNGKVILSAKLNPADTTASVQTAPTITSGRIYFVSGTQEEWVSFTGVSGTTLTGLTRGLSQTAVPATAWTGKTWIAGSVGLIVAMHDQLFDKQTDNTDLVGEFGFGSTTIGGFRANNLTEAQRDALASSANGMTIYNTTAGQMEWYEGGAWIPNQAGGTVANASETVAGKVELATDAQVDAETDTGETGAKLTVVPSQLKRVVTQVSAWVPADSDGFVFTDGSTIEKITKTDLFDDIRASVHTESYTLGSTMTAGDIATLREDWFIHKFAGSMSADQTAGFTSSNSIKKVIRLTDTLIVAFYVVTAHEQLARAGTISGTTITWWTAVQVGSGTSTSNVLGCRLDDTTFVAITQSNNSNPEYNYAIAGTVAGTTITLGSTVTLNTNTVWGTGIYDIIRIGASKFACAFNQSTSGDTLIACTVSGTTITKGTELDTGSVVPAKLCPVSDDVYLMFSTTTAYRVTVSGTTTTIGSTLSLGSTYTTPFVEYISSTQALFVGTTGGNVVGVVVNWTPSTPTKWSDYTLDTGATVAGLSLYGTSGFTVSCGTTNAMIFGIYDSTTLTVNDELDITTFTAGQVVYIDSSRNLLWKNSGASIVTTFFSNEINKLVGVLQESGVATDSKPLVTTWSLSTVHSWLTAWLRYYSDSAGELTLSNESDAGYGKLIGIAQSATDLFVSISN